VAASRFQKKLTSVGGHPKETCLKIWVSKIQGELKMARKRNDDQVPAKPKRVKPKCPDCGGTLGFFGGCSLCAQRERIRKREERRQKEENKIKQHARQRHKDGLA